MTRVFRDGKNHKAELESDVHQPRYLPIQDASGKGWLDLEHAVLDLRAYRHIVTRGDMHLDRAAMLLEGATFKPFSACELEERYVDHGETLYVLGVVTSREVDPAQGGYRLSGAPVIGGTEERPVIVHAGTERSLLASLRRERVFLDAAFALVVFLAVGLLAVTVGAIAAW